MNLRYNLIVELNTKQPKEPINPHSVRKPIEDFRTLSIRILHYANLGVSRIAFLRQSSKILLEFSGCDGIEIRVKDQELFYCCEAKRDPKKSFRFEVINPLMAETGMGCICFGANTVLDKLCGNVMHARFDPESHFFTRNGTFWTSDADNPLFLSEASLVENQPKNPVNGYKSLVIVPFVVDDENNGVLVLKSLERFFFTEGEIELYETTAQNLGSAIAARRARSDCHERVKELTCLYNMTCLANRPGITLEELLSGFVELLPPAWQYPEITCARITLDGREFVTSNFSEGKSSQKAKITIDGKQRGMVEVVYIENRPVIYEGPFLREERNLIDAVATEIAHIIKTREAEDYKHQLQEQLRHADRLATIGQLAAGVAHELNEPLGAILGFSQLVKKNPMLPDQISEDINKIVNASLHAREVVKKLLFFARQVPTKKTMVDLNQIAAEGLYFLESRCAKEQIQVVKELDPNIKPIFADPGQIHQVLVNLVVNAIQAMPDGGVLTLKTTAEEGKIVLEVRDTGVGMTDEVKKQVFIPFFTTKEVGQGTGLGLAVVHGIVTSHGGDIRVDSEVGKGSSFIIALPDAESADGDRS